MRESIVVSNKLPAALRDAAILYATDTKTEGLALRLIVAFGIAQLGDEAHRRAVMLCALAVRKVLYGWQALECEGHGPATAIEATENWVRAGTAPADWKPLCEPAKAIRGGELIRDCDICRAGPIASAAALTARFAMHGAASDAADVLFNVWNSVDEGVHWPDSMAFEAWIATIALPAAYDLRALTEQELRA
jgi:hypothetical protein